MWSIAKAKGQSNRAKGNSDTVIFRKRDKKAKETRIDPMFPLLQNEAASLKIVICNELYLWLGHGQISSLRFPLMTLIYLYLSFLIQNHSKVILVQFIVCNSRQMENSTLQDRRMVHYDYGKQLLGKLMDFGEHMRTMKNQA